MVSHVPELMGVIVAFEPFFTKGIWPYVVVLIRGALLSVGQRTVASALRATGHGADPRFENYHRVLSRDAWSGMGAARALARQLVSAFAPRGPIVVGVDDTIERRWGKEISARGIYRDPVRSSGSHFVKTSGLRWVSVMLLSRVPWTGGGVMGLPVLTALSPSERYYEGRGRAHKKLTDVARGALLAVARWFPGRKVVAVGDSSYASIELLSSLAAGGVSVVTRLRMDAGLYEPAPPRRAGTNGRPRVKGGRLPKLSEVLSSKKTRWRRVLVRDWYGESWREVETTTGTAVWYHPGMPVLPLRWVLVRDPRGEFPAQAFLSTDLRHGPKLMLDYFVRRWKMEVTFREVRDHLGVETQRQWSDKAIRRTTPCLMGLFSVVSLAARELLAPDSAAAPGNRASWYEKQNFTFSDALAAVRSGLWRDGTFSMSPRGADTVKIPRPLYDVMTQTLAYAA